MQGRIENIFTDSLYNQFAADITEMLRIWRPKLSPSGMKPSGITSFHSRILSPHHAHVAFMLSAALNLFVTAVIKVHIQYKGHGRTFIS